MPSLKEDIEEFIGLPFKDIVKQVVEENHLKGDADYIVKIRDDMFPFGMKAEDKWDLYKSDKYSAYLFWKAVQEMEENRPSVPQMLANIAQTYYSMPRILIYGCGTGLVALGLRCLDLENKDITIADIPGRYFEFLQFLSIKYDLGFKFIYILKGAGDPFKQKYEIILYNSIPSDGDRTIKITQLAAHVEDLQNLYLNADAPVATTSYRNHRVKALEEADMEAVIIEDGFWRVWRKKFVPAPEEEPLYSPEKIREARIFPTSIACLSTIPGTACGIATYTGWLAEALTMHYPTGIFRDINKDIPKSALILASIEFGIFEETSMLINPAYANNWKFAIWHTVMRDPFQGYTKYLKDIDNEYDAHVVHTLVQKSWLSKFVDKPIYIIPHGTLLWDPIPAAEAKAKLGLSGMKVAFMFGFAADNKGMDELIEVSNIVNVTTPDFRLVMSAGVNTASKYATEYTGNLQNNLKIISSKSSGTIVLGKYLTEDEINLWASAADMLIFNYKTPPFVASASGAMKRVLAAGKPIICVDDNRLEDLVEGEHCLKFKSGDLNALTQCIETLLTNKKLADQLGQNCRKLAERTSWDRIGEKFMGIFGSTIKGFGPDYYDEAYFIGKQGGKKFTTPTGEAKEWSYYNPEGEWLGAEYVMKAIQKILNPKEMLSVGEGRGTFCAYAQDCGIVATGIDFSQWAIDHPYSRARGLVELGDVRDLKFEDESVDLLFCSDIMEHIYTDDLPNAISEIKRVAKKWIFYNIGSSMMGDENDDLVVEKNRLPPKNRLTTVIAGHVTVRNEAWWREKLGGDGWRFRDDLVTEFRRIVPAEVLMNWKCVLISERVV
jgi:glycosyltransferase involved in cell wall biosynthesis